MHVFTQIDDAIDRAPNQSTMTTQTRRNLHWNLQQTDQIKQPTVQQEMPTFWMKLCDQTMSHSHTFPLPPQETNDLSSGPKETILIVERTCAGNFWVGVFLQASRSPPPALLPTAKSLSVSGQSPNRLNQKFQLFNSNFLRMVTPLGGSQAIDAFLVVVSGVHKSKMLYVDLDRIALLATNHNIIELML